MAAVVVCTFRLMSHLTTMTSRLLGNAKLVKVHKLLIKSPHSNKAISLGQDDGVWRKMTGTADYYYFMSILPGVRC